MDPKVRERAQELRDQNPGMKIPESHLQALREKGVSEGVPKDLREPGCDDRVSSEPAPIGETLAPVVEQAKKTPVEVFHNQSENDKCPFGQGPRAKGQPRRKSGPAKGGEKKRPEERGSTHLARWNRGQGELSIWAFAVMVQLWIWNGAPAKGDLPYWTIHSMARFFRTDRNVIRRARRELISKGWLECKPYDCHHKNTLYRLVPIREVPVPIGVEDKK